MDDKLQYATICNNVICNETKRNEKYLRKRETKINESIFKETKLKRKNKSVSRKKIEILVIFTQIVWISQKLL
jgi:hypothetical protein